MFGEKEVITFGVEDMHCAHCQAKVEATLKAVKGVKKVVVSLEDKTATVTVRAGKVSVDTLKAAVKEAGFGVTE